MTAIASDAAPGSEAPAQPIDAVVERLNDPTVAASLVTLLDNAELLSTLAIGLSAFIERSEVIMDSVAEGVNEFRASGAWEGVEDRPSLGEMTEVAREFAAASPALKQILNSPMVRPETIDLLGTLSEASTESAARVRDGDARTSLWATLTSLRDPEVQRGLGFVIEFSRALGRRMNAT